MIKKIASAALVVGSLFAVTGCSSSAPSESSTAAVQEASLTFADGWVRVSEFSDHTGGMTGVFATITNSSAKDVTLVGGSAEIANVVEVHEVVMLDGEMKMQAKDGGILIPAGESVTLEPGGLHVMLMGLKKPILDGDMITVTLDFEGADSQTFTWPAKASLSGDEEYHSNH